MLIRPIYNTDKTSKSDASRTISYSIEQFVDSISGER